LKSTLKPGKFEGCGEARGPGWLPTLAVHSDDNLLTTLASSLSAQLYHDARKMVMFAKCCLSHICLLEAVLRAASRLAVRASMFAIDLAAPAPL